MANCGICYGVTVETWPSRMFPDDRICESCKDYEDYWLSLTPAQQREEHRMADEYAEECER